MGHHRRAASPGWLGRVIRWWRRREQAAQNMELKADQALTKARQQQHDVHQTADFVDRALRAFRRAESS